MLPAALALLGGAAHSASLAWPFSIGPLSALGLHYGEPVWWLQLLAMVMLAFALGAATPHRPSWQTAALRGWLFASVWFGLTFGWLFVALHTYGGLPSLLAALAVAVLAALLALYYAAATALFMRMRDHRSAGSALLFAALWLLAELARGSLLSGFGWGAGGYAQVSGPLAVLAPWIGVNGLTALVAWLAMTLVQWLRLPVRQSPPTPWQRARVWLPLPLLAALCWGATLVPTSSSSGRLSVTLLQGNIAQDEKFEVGSGVPLALQWYAEQLKAARGALVLAPETAIPLLPQQLPDNYWSDLQRHFSSGHQAAMIGTPLGDEQSGYTNSVLALKPAQAQPWRYDKQHLVPFGEFIPPLFKWFTRMMHIPLGDFNRGAPRQALFAWQGQRLAANICYEDLFGEELAPHFDDPAQAPTIFVNVSNLAWFGAGLAQQQHLQIARMRAIEFERPFVLVTNTGTSAIVDHRGQVLARLPRDIRSVLVGAVEGRSGITPYAWWLSRFGLWPLWGLALALLLAGAYRCFTEPSSKRRHAVMLGL